jgi:glycosyltransferase involved in cell wall biosynthesis
MMTTDLLWIPQSPVKKRILYVVHRYAPFQGGSENYVRDMAEETLSRGYEVGVFAGDHQGDYHGVTVTSDTNILLEPWDLIVVHGGDVAVQNFVLENIERLGGPVLYLLILPSNSTVCTKALRTARYIGCSTPADWRHLERYQIAEKGVQVRHGINRNTSVGYVGFRAKYKITTPFMFLSAGGYWPNKAFQELVQCFNAANRTDATLVLTGYDNRHGLMPKETEFVKPFLFEDRADMLSALASADLYILNSYTEGFGLVLLESMLNKIAWCGRRIAGAELMCEYGYTYTTPQELTTYLTSFQGQSYDQGVAGYKYVIGNHLITHTVDDIVRLV